MCGVGAVQLMTGRAEWGVWVVLTGRWGCLRWVELLGAGLAAVAVNAVALICKLVRTGFLTVRDPLWLSEDIVLSHPGHFDAVSIRGSTTS